MLSFIISCAAFQKWNVFSSSYRSAIGCVLCRLCGGLNATGLRWTRNSIIYVECCQTAKHIILGYSWIIVIFRCVHDYYFEVQKNSRAHRFDDFCQFANGNRHLTRIASSIFEFNAHCNHFNVQNCNCVGCESNCVCARAHRNESRRNGMRMTTRNSIRKYRAKLSLLYGRWRKMDEMRITNWIKDQYYSIIQQVVSSFAHTNLCVLFLFAHLLRTWRTRFRCRSDDCNLQQPALTLTHIHIHSSQLTHMNCLFAVASASYASRPWCNRNKLVDKTKRRLKRRCFRFHQFN